MSFVGAGSILAQMMDWDHGGTSWIWMTLMMIFVAAVVVAIVYLIVRSQHQGQHPMMMTHVPPAGTQESPMDIAKRRYALGEISSEEFDKMKRDLGG